MDTAALGARLLRSRRVARAPVWLFRHGLGGVLGDRIIMLEHTGRHTGRARYVCLEVVERRTPESLTLVSGFGERAQWFRNLRAEPRCRVTVRGRLRDARARVLSADEAAAGLARYQQAHPRAWRGLRAVIERAVGRRVDELPMVEVTLDDRGRG